MKRVTWTTLATERAYLLLVAAYVAGILALPLFPTQDGPQHLYYAVVQGAVMQSGSAAYGGEFVVRSALPPYSFMTYFLLAASRVVSGAMAEKLLACLYIVTLCLGFRYLARAVCGRTPAMALLVFPFVLHTLVMLGFYNYNIGLAVMLFTCGFWLRHGPNLTWRASAAFVLLVVLHLVTHPFPLLMAVAFIGAEMLLSARRAPVAARAREAAHLALMIAGLAGVTLFLSSRGFAEWSFGYPLWRDRAIRLVKLHILVPYENWALWAAVGLAAACVVAGSVAVARARQRGRRLDASELFFLFGAGCAIAAVVAPSHLNAWAHLDERFPILAVLFLLAAAGKITLPEKALPALGIGATALACTVLLLEFQATAAHARIVEPLLTAPPAATGSRGVIVTRDHDSAFPRDTRFSPCLWAPAHYFRRSEAILLNASWLDLPQIPLGLSRAAPYSFTDPPAMAAYLTERVASQGPGLPEELDLMIAVDCRDGGAGMPDVESVAAHYGLRRAAWSTPEFAVFLRPGAERR